MVSSFSRIFAVHRFSLCGLVTALLLSTAIAQTPPRKSPFNRPTAAPSTVSASPDSTEYELTGITKLGDATVVCVTVIATRKSHWIKIGESSNGIHALAHDPETGQVTIRRSGRDIALMLKKQTYDPSMLTAYEPTLPSGPVPMAGVAAPVALTDEDKATEARMLVSDLLEIGMIQRKAYQEAQTKERDDQRAAAKDSANAPTPQ
ncbi:hypothetical protein [Synoicihabitans lomoniglobus]|uniref:Secreted protein n=1 Tax=Synoicihabitans lomoniglobus TaxID=2909285 RepID=A0AAF0CSU4_9BACT|nr:hypothetical protein [Opitutaceae bacterium LMO-M01]WED67405.1 hypothetical protein PXH66_11150 [Opitutaceae bacterium LMO-M01]